MSVARLDPGDSIPLVRRFAHTFGRMPSEVARARHLMDACLATWDVSDAARADLVLVVGELVSNAVIHGRGSVELLVNASDTVLRVEVCDQGGGQPRLRPVERSGPEAGGWGLRLVDQLVDMWGTTVRPGRTVVWVQRATRARAVKTLQGVQMSAGVPLTRRSAAG